MPAITSTQYIAWSIAFCRASAIGEQKLPSLYAWLWKTLGLMLPTLTPFFSAISTVAFAA